MACSWGDQGAPKSRYQQSASTRETVDETLNIHVVGSSSFRRLVKDANVSLRHFRGYEVTLDHRGSCALD